MYVKEVGLDHPYTKVLFIVNVNKYIVNSTEVIQKVEVGQDHNLPSTVVLMNRAGVCPPPLQKSTVGNECKQIDHQEHRGHSKRRSRSRS